ncbi:aspartate aminotransferase, cytoplasmic [Chrysoperla carnea]|uniref:aspartate aminotransferase, cytoplasmic n=1 Tax=Chrysoperla carnea TaxID=189513 RepID=UPI001D0781B9|nr:aspartate aminotransferase, cytoplasmic [Chrysoperla carnea]
MASRFADVPLGPPIEVFALMKAFADDPHPNKVNLGAGTYKTEESKPWVLPVVRETELMMANDVTLNHEYLPILGMEAFSKAATSLLLGEDNVAINEQRAFGIQTLSGTGALRVGADFLAKVCKYTVFYYSNPTWENHRLLFLNAGFESARTYRYWDESGRCLDIKGFLEDLKNAPPHSVIILHAIAHNPTGCDPTQEQWKQIADVCEERQLFPFFDSAYQGFASGDVDKDAWAVRYFVSRGFEIFCAQSFAKNFGLYNERVGNLTVVTKDSSNVPQIKSQLTLIVRGCYSNPPNHGARIVATILTNPDLNQKWKKCIEIMSTRIKEMRILLNTTLKALGTPGNWDHILTQIGMFSYTGLSKRQVENMVKKHRVYLLSSGRINMCGITKENVKYVAEAIHDSVRSFPDISSGDSNEVAKF